MCADFLQVYSAESMPLYIRDLGTFLFHVPQILTNTLNLFRHGASHLSLVAFLLYHWVHLAHLREVLQTIRGLHMVFCLVHHRHDPHLLVRSLFSSPRNACPC